MRPYLISLILLGCVAQAHAQGAFSGSHQYPSQRNFSGLPGSGFGVLPNGRIDFRGAMAYSTPVAYTLAGSEIYLGVTMVANKLGFAFSDNKRGGSREGDGTAQAIVGTSLGRYGKLSSGFVLLSSARDTMFSFQWSPHQTGDLRWAIGVQDLRGNAGYSGEGRPDDNKNSTTPYAVVTKRIAPDLYGSVGYGNRRFRGVFGNVSWSPVPRTKLVVEHDSLSSSILVAFDLGPIGHSPYKDRRARGQIGIGVQQGRFGLWFVGVNL